MQPLDFDFHTHNLQAPPGRSIVNVPDDWVVHPERFVPRAGMLYSAGIHPWLTADKALTQHMLRALPTLLAHPQVVALGECGLDALRGADMPEQERIFGEQIVLAEEYRLPLTLHVVRAFDRLLHMRKRCAPTTQWTVHGFRGKPALARQLLDAGIDLSFGAVRNAESYLLTPPDRRHDESDAPYTTHQ